LRQALIDTWRLVRHPLADNPQDLNIASHAGKDTEFSARSAELNGDWLILGLPGGIFIEWQPVH
jgi:hypothetical protein